METIVRTGKAGDAEALADLGRRSFYEKWKNNTSAENMKSYLDENYLSDKIRSELEDESIHYVVAEKDGVLVGFARLLYTFPDVQEFAPEANVTSKKPMEVSRIYVSPELIGQSIGAKMMEKIIDLAKEKNCDLLWLGVWEKNPAVRFYQRFGFVKAGTHQFALGDQIDTDTVMVRRI
jgi:diamine N-acetyltransferase